MITVPRERDGNIRKIKYHLSFQSTIVEFNHDEVSGYFIHNELFAQVNIFTLFYFQYLHPPYGIFLSDIWYLYGAL